MKVLAICAKCCENTEKDDFYLSMGAGRTKGGGQKSMYRRSDSKWNLEK